MIETQLRQAEQRVEIGEKQVAVQREIADSLEQLGQDSTSARELLVIFENMQLKHIARRNRLRELVGLRQPETKKSRNQ